MGRFIVMEENIKNVDENGIIIFGDEVKHIQVLRKDVGDTITVNENMYQIEEMKRDSIKLKFVDKAPKIGVPITDITLYIALLKTDKLDLVVQKAVEIGVKKIVLFTSSNVVVKLDEKNKIKRVEKLQKIAQEACKQCGRTDSVEVEGVLSFKELETEIQNRKVTLFAYEASQEALRKELNSIKQNNITEIGVIIGAEGGFTPKEADELKSVENVKCVSLGTRILRAETAAINLVSIVIYEMEE